MSTPKGWVKHPTISYEDVMMSDRAAEEYNKWLKNRGRGIEVVPVPSKHQRRVQVTSPAPIQDLQPRWEDGCCHKTVFVRCFNCPFKKEK